jgi:hypothetical protein
MYNQNALVRGRCQLRRLRSKMRSLLLSLTLLAAIAGAAGADVISIPLPELVGTYQALEGVLPDQGVFDRVTTLVLPPELTAIEQLQLVVSGTWHVGEQLCYMGEGPQLLPWSVALSMLLTIPEGPLEFIAASVRPDDGEFVDLTDEFSSWGGLEIDQLLGATIEAYLFVDGGIIGVCGVTEDSWGEVTEVHLEITGTVPVESSTWGAVKSLYR